MMIRRFHITITSLILLIALIGVSIGYWLKYGEEQASKRGFALIKVETDPVRLPGQPPRTPEEIEQELATQVQLITSPNVLLATAVEPAVKVLPVLSTSKDGESALRSHLVVERLPNSSLIKISARGLPQPDASIIVNAVSKNYLKSDREWVNGQSSPMIESLERYHDMLDVELSQLGDQLSLLESQEVVLEAGTISLPRELAQVELGDSLRQLRRIRLLASAAKSRLERLGEDSTSRSETAEQINAELAELGAQESLLLSECGSLSQALAASEDGHLKADSIRSKIKRLEDHASHVEGSLRSLRFDQQSGGRLILIAYARPSAGVLAELPLSCADSL
jgi:transcriptional regulator with XRE-family HTH domain